MTAAPGTDGHSDSRHWSFTTRRSGFRVVVTTPDAMPLTIGVVSQLVRADTFAWGQIMAGSLLAALPPVVIYALLMDYYIAGLTAGATKG